MVLLDFDLAIECRGAVVLAGTVVKGCGVVVTLCCGVVVALWCGVVVALWCGVVVALGCGVVGDLWQRKWQYVLGLESGDKTST